MVGDVTSPSLPAERAILQERVRVGLARTRSEGKRLGRPRIASELEKRFRKVSGDSGRPGVRVIAVAVGAIQKSPRTTVMMNSRRPTREGGPQNFWVPSAAIATVSRRTQFALATAVPVTHLGEMPYSRRDCSWRGRTSYHPFVCAIGPIP